MLVQEYKIKITQKSVDFLFVKFKNLQQFQDMLKDNLVMELDVLCIVLLKLNQFNGIIWDSKCKN